MTLLLFSSNCQGRFASLRALALGACFSFACLIPACGQADALSTDTGNPPVIIDQKLHVVPSDSGVLVTGDAGAVTPGASVQVANVSRGESRVTTAAGDGSFEVELSGTPEDEYRVEASLGGRTTSTELSPSGMGPIELSGREFLLDSSQGFTPVEGTTIRLSFEESNFSIQAGCNTLSGSYSQCDGKLCASDLITTDIGCSAPLHTQDEWLADFVTSQPNSSLSRDRLTLQGTDATLEFLDREVENPDRLLSASTWTIDTLIDAGLASSIPEQALPILEFRDGGFLYVNTTCNQAGGRYSVDGETLILSDMSYTDQPCSTTGNPTAAAHITRVLSNGTLNFEIDAQRLTLERGDIGLSATTE